MMKSDDEVAFPAGVSTVMRPEPLAPGTVTVTDVELSAVTVGTPPLIRGLVLAATVSKFVPETVTDVVAVPVVGVKLAIVGAFDVETVNAVALDADPLGVVTEIVPVVAPVGTDTTRLFVVAAVTVAAVPLNDTEFWLAVALNPRPYSVTVVPTEPACGANSTIATLPALVRAIEVRLPTAS